MVPNSQRDAEGSRFLAPLTDIEFVPCGPAKTRILVVEDQANVAELFLDHLSRYRCDPIFARSLEEADLLISHKSFRAAIIDLNLPDGDGSDLIHRWRKTGAVPYIIATTADGDLQRSCLHSKGGYDAFLPKPFGIADFESCLPADIPKRPASGPMALPRQHRPRPSIENQFLRTVGEIALAEKNSSAFRRAAHHFINEAFARRFEEAARVFSLAEEAARADDWPGASDLWLTAWKDLARSGWC